MMKTANRNMVSTLAILSALGLSTVAHAGQSVETKGDTAITPSIEESASPDAATAPAMDSHGDTTATDGMSSGTSDDRTVAAIEGEPVEGQIIWQDENTYLVSSLMGTYVYTPGGETIGDINDVLATKDGVIDGVVIGVGGFLGLGEKDVAIEYDRIDLAQVDGELRFVLDVTEDELDKAPEFKTVEAQLTDEQGDLPEALQTPDTTDQPSE